MAQQRILAAVLCLSALGGSLVAPGAGPALGYLGDAGSHPPPTSGAHAYFPTSGAFGPGQSGFPAVGGTFVDPVFGSTIRRLTNELPQFSFAEIYAKNGFTNADNTLMYHRSPSGRTFIDTTSGQVVRSNVPGNFDSSFAPDDPDVWYWFNWGDTRLHRYRVSTGSSTVVKTFAEPLGQLGGSVDFIDGSGRYMALMLGSSIRVYDVKDDVLYAGSIPASYAASGGWAAMSPDGHYVVTATDPPKFHSFKIDHGARSVSTAAVLFWTLCGDHADLVSASNGKTYLVGFECHSEAAIYAVDVSKPQSAGDPARQRAENKRIVKLASWTDTAGHFSGVSKGAMRDWFFFDIESGDDTFSSAVTGAWRPYMQEVVMANVLTGEVRRLAHHRSRSPLANYFYTPRVSASWDGTLVAWVSNFGYSAAGYADVYAIRNPGGAAAGSGASAGTSGSGAGSSSSSAATALAVSFTAPAAGATVSGTTTVSMAGSGGAGGYSYALSIDSVPTPSAGPSYSWNTATAANGAHSLRVTVTDASGATATATRSVLVQNSTASALVKVNGNWYLHGAGISDGLALSIVNDPVTAAGYGVPWPVPGTTPVSVSAASSSASTSSAAGASSSGSSSSSSPVAVATTGSSVLKNVGGNWYLNGAYISTGLANGIMTDPGTAAAYGVAWPVNGASTPAAVASTPVTTAATTSGGGSLVKKGGDWYLNGSAISGGLASAIMSDPGTAASYGVAWPVSTAGASPAPVVVASSGGGLVKKKGDWYLNGSPISSSLAAAIMNDPAVASGYGLGWPVATSSE